MVVALVADLAETMDASLVERKVAWSVAAMVDVMVCSREVEWVVCLVAMKEFVKDDWLVVVWVVWRRKRGVEKTYIRKFMRGCICMYNKRRNMVTDRDGCDVGY